MNTLLDKSALQLLPAQEYRLFSQYCHFQVAPIVLVSEIMDDLTKSEDVVKGLARRFDGSGHTVHVWHEDLLRDDLLGDPVAMDGRMYPLAVTVAWDRVRSTITGIFARFSTA